MGKKGKRGLKRLLKAKSMTPPDSDAGAETTVETVTERLQRENEETSLGLTLGPLKLIAKSPFNTIINPRDSVTLWSEDNVEFFVSRSILQVASPHFCNQLTSDEQAAEEAIELPPSLEWELSACGPIVEMDEPSAVLDPLLRFIYPVLEPVFKEPVKGESVNELPYRLMGPIYDAAEKYDFKYVCRRIVDIANGMIYIKALPEPGLAVLRAYGVACRLKLDYDAKLKAARNTLCVPYKTSPTAGLEGEGVTKVDIQKYAEFHKRAVQACQELLQLSDVDAYPDGLSDVYATFIACSQCNGTSSQGTAIRCGAARWWQLYVANALEKLCKAPLDPTIFSENFLTPVFREAQNCEACAGVVHWKWCNMMPMLAHMIPAKVYEVDLDNNGKDDMEE